MSQLSEAWDVKEEAWQEVSRQHQIACEWTFRYLDNQDSPQAIVFRRKALHEVRKLDSCIKVSKKALSAYEQLDIN